MTANQNTNQSLPQQETSELAHKEAGPGPFAVLTLVCGIFSILSCCTVFGALFFGLASLIFGLIELAKESRGETSPSGKTITIIGLVIGVLSFILGLFSLTGLLIVLDPVREAIEEFIQKMPGDYL